MIRRLAATGLALAMAASLRHARAAPALAAQCGGDFNAFLSAFSREAAAQKISPQTIQTRRCELTPDRASSSSTAGKACSSRPSSSSGRRA